MGICGTTLRPRHCQQQRMMHATESSPELRAVCSLDVEPAVAPHLQVHKLLCASPFFPMAPDAAEIWQALQDGREARFFRARHRSADLLAL